MIDPVEEGGGSRATKDARQTADMVRRANKLQRKVAQDSPMGKRVLKVMQRTAKRSRPSMQSQESIANARPGVSASRPPRKAPSSPSTPTDTPPAGAPKTGVPGTDPLQWKGGDLAKWKVQMKRFQKTGKYKQFQRRQSTAAGQAIQKVAGPAGQLTPRG